MDEPEPRRKIQPNKFTAIKREAYVEALRKGLRRGKAADSVGISRQQVRAYAKDFPEFQDQIDQAEIDACDDVEDALRTAAINGNVTACLAWLFNRSGGRWMDKRNPVQVVGTSSEGEALKLILERLKEANAP